MIYTQSDLDALDLAIASGELSVTTQGRTVTYRSIDDLLKARRHVAGLLQAGRAPTIGGLSYSLGRFDR